MYSCVRDVCVCAHASVWVDMYVCVWCGMYIGVGGCVRMCGVCVYTLCLYAYVCGMFALCFTSLTVLFSFSCPSSCVRLDVHFWTSVCVKIGHTLCNFNFKVARDAPYHVRPRARAYSLVGQTLWLTRLWTSLINTYLFATPWIYQSQFARPSPLPATPVLLRVMAYSPSPLALTTELSKISLLYRTDV